MTGVYISLLLLFFEFRCRFFVRIYCFFCIFCLSFILCSTAQEEKSTNLSIYFDNKSHRSPVPYVVCQSLKTNERIFSSPLIRFLCMYLAKNAYSSVYSSNFISFLYSCHTLIIQRSGILFFLHDGHFLIVQSFFLFLSSCGFCFQCP